MNTNIFKTGLLLVALSVSSICAFAHDEVDPDPEAWKRSIALGFNLTDGNSETTLLTFDFKARREKGKNIWNIELRESYGETATLLEEGGLGDDQTTVDETTGIIEYKRLIDDRWYFGAYVAGERDDIADIEYRAIPGVTLGYFLVKNDDLQLSVDIGPSYVFEEVGGITNEYFAPRIGERLDWKISETASVYQTLSVLFDTEDSDNYLINAEAGIVAALSSSINLILSVKDTYDNVPAEGFEENDVVLTSALGVTF